SAFHSRLTKAMARLDRPRAHATWRLRQLAAMLLTSNAALKMSLAPIKKGTKLMRIRSAAAASLAFALAAGAASTASAQFYSQHNLQSDGAVPADFTDPDLVNAWGLVASSTSPWWVADNGTGRSTLYNGNTGVKVLINPPAGHVVVPGPPPHSAP